MIEAVDTIILAGDKSASRRVLGKNKLFLEINKIPLLVYVLNALEKVERIGNICIVGPRADIEKLLLSNRNHLNHNKTIDVLEQKESIYQNFWSAFTHTIPDYYDGIEETDENIREKQVFTLAADMPFITAHEISEFLDLCAATSVDYCLGVTEEKHLRKFYPTDEKIGIEMTYLHLRDGNYRLNNLHLMRPFKILNRTYIETIYDRRYQKSPANIVKMAYDFIVNQSFGIKPLYLYTILELSILFRYLKLPFMVNLLRKLVSQQEMTRYAGILLNTHIEIINTTRGGAALDIDSEEDFKTATTMHTEWVTMIQHNNGKCC